MVSGLGYILIHARILSGSVSFIVRSQNQALTQQTAASLRLLADQF